MYSKTFAFLTSFFITSIAMAGAASVGGSTEAATRRIFCGQLSTEQIGFGTAQELFVLNVQRATILLNVTEPSVKKNLKSLFQIPSKAILCASAVPMQFTPQHLA